MRLNSSPTSNSGSYSQEEVDSWQSLHRVGIQGGSQHCNQWISIKRNGKYIKAKIVEATSSADPTFIVASSKVFTDIGSWTGVGTLSDFSWKICDNNGSKDACPSNNYADSSEGDDEGDNDDEE